MLQEGGMSRCSWPHLCQSQRNRLGEQGTLDGWTVATVCCNCHPDEAPMLQIYNALHGGRVQVTHVVLNDESENEGHPEQEQPGRGRQ